MMQDFEVVIGGHPEDPPILGTLSAWEAFEKSAVWQDIVNYLDDSVLLTKNELIHENDMGNVRRHQERVKVLETLKELPSIFIQELRREQQINEQQEEGNGQE